MKFETFQTLLNTMKAISDRISKLYDLDVDLINFSDKYEAAITILMKEVFSETQIDTIEWWLYENVEKYIYSSSNTDEILHDLTTIEELYKYVTETLA